VAAAVMAPHGPSSGKSWMVGTIFRTGASTLSPCAGQHLCRQPAKSLTQVALVHVLKLHENNLSGYYILGRSNSVFFDPSDDETSDELD